MIEWDFNDYIWVKLTDFGRQVHRETHEKLADQIFRKTGTKQSYVPPDADADGWSKFQGWYLLWTFGPYMRPGTDLPFETRVRIERIP